ncbi:hypothetical protein DITRI_Ditri15bG0006600 [Diplodiscus trichospermus]
MLVSQAFCARVRLLDRETGFDVVFSQKIFQVLLPSKAGYKPSDCDKNVRHQPLVLNRLPKGTLPPSGPSKRTNTLAN